MKILSLTGGGTSGYITLGILEKIEKELNIEIKDIFNMICGVSTGALIGAAISTNKKITDIKKSYIDMFPKIFGSKRSWLMSLFKPTYDVNNLNSVIKSYFGDTRLSECSKKFMTYALKLNEPSLQLKFWKSWNPENDPLLSDCLTATSCAPVAFAPWKIDENYYHDGGITMNNPTMCAIAEGFNFKWDHKTIMVLTINTDKHKGFKNPQNNVGLLKSIYPVVNYAVDGGESSIDYIAKRILNNNFVSVVPDVYLDVDSEDWKKMDEAIDKTWNEYKNSIIDFINA